MGLVMSVIQGSVITVSTEKNGDKQAQIIDIQKGYRCLEGKRVCFQDSGYLETTRLSLDKQEKREGIISF